MASGMRKSMRALWCSAVLRYSAVGRSVGRLPGGIRMATASVSASVSCCVGRVPMCPGVALSSAW